MDFDFNDADIGRGEYGEPTPDGLGIDAEPHSALEADYTDHDQDQDQEEKQEQQEEEERTATPEPPAPKQVAKGKKAGGAGRAKPAARRSSTVGSKRAVHDSEGDEYEPPTGDGAKSGGRKKAAAAAKPKAKKPTEKKKPTAGRGKRKAPEPVTDEGESDGGSALEDDDAFDLTKVMDEFKDDDEDGGDTASSILQKAVSEIKKKEAIREATIQTKRQKVKHQVREEMSRFNEAITGFCQEHITDLAKKSHKAVEAAKKQDKVLADVVADALAKYTECNSAIVGMITKTASDLSKAIQEQKKGQKDSSALPDAEIWRALQANLSEITSDHFKATKKHLALIEKSSKPVEVDFKIAI